MPRPTKQKLKQRRRSIEKRTQTIIKKRKSERRKLIAMLTEGFRSYLERLDHSKEISEALVDAMMADSEISSIDDLLSMAEKGPTAVHTNLRKHFRQWWEKMDIYWGYLPGEEGDKFPYEFAFINAINKEERKRKESERTRRSLRRIRKARSLRQQRRKDPFDIEMIDWDIHNIDWNLL